MGGRVRFAMAVGGEGETDRSSWEGAGGSEGEGPPLRVGRLDPSKDTELRAMRAERAGVVRRPRGQVAIPVGRPRLNHI